MNNYTAENPTLRDLFTDAAKEVIERNRIKAQMNKILEIVEADSMRLRKAHSEIGRMYCEGTLEENSGRVEVLKGLAKHLNQRIERAKLRYDELQKAHSVDDCTKAFKAELQVKLREATENTAVIAKDLSEKAKSKAQDITEKAKATLKKSDKAELSEEQDRELLSLIKEQLDENDEATQTAEETVEKIHGILASLSEDSDTDEASEEVSKVVENIVEEAITELSEGEGGDEVAEDFTF